ncbi:MAG: SEC-C motif-containing protein [Flavobacteriales bacterium]|jgi:SEC-C motif-containing protein
MNIPRHTFPKLCPCNLRTRFLGCCGLYLFGKKKPLTAVKLMRSRYSAYALGGFGQYLVDTWWSSDQHLNVDQLSTREFDWQGLEIIDKQTDGHTAEVEFKAFYGDIDRELDKNSNATSGLVKSDTRGCLHERSSFRRENGRWYYVTGKIL